jgi:hypothetical protein
MKVENRSVSRQGDLKEIGGAEARGTIVANDLLDKRGAIE